MMIFNSLRDLLWLVGAGFLVLFSLFTKRAIDDLSNEISRKRQRRALRGNQERYRNSVGAALSAGRRDGSLSDRLRDGRF